MNKDELRIEIEKMNKLAKEKLGILLDIALRIRETYIQKRSWDWAMSARAYVENYHGYVRGLYMAGLATENDLKKAMALSIMGEELEEIIVNEWRSIKECFVGWVCLKCGKRMPLHEPPKGAYVGQPRRCTAPNCKGTLRPLPSEWFAKNIQSIIEGRLKSIKKSWIFDADYKFVNEHGEEWYARILDDGKIVEVTGSDVDWEVERIHLLPDYKQILEGIEKGIYPYVMNEKERAWLKSVLLVAIQLAKWKGEIS